MVLEFGAAGVKVQQKKLRENPKIESMMNKISGVVFMGLGIKLLTEKA